MFSQWYEMQSKTRTLTEKLEAPAEDTAGTGGTGDTAGTADDRLRAVVEG
jgi:hypothetical protein